MKITIKIIQENLYLLTDRESRILISRLGLFDNKSNTLKECSNIFNISKSRIHQIESKALMKIYRKIKLYA